MMEKSPSTDTDGLCRKILERKVNIDDLAAEEQLFCDIDDDKETSLGSLALLETTQEIRKSMQSIMRWSELISWCKEKSRTAHPEMREMYDDAVTEFLTSAAHRYYEEATTAEQAAILGESFEFPDPVEYLFHILNQKYGPKEDGTHRMAA